MNATIVAAAIVFSVAARDAGGCAPASASYTASVVGKQPAIWIGVQKDSVADDRRSAVFLRPYTLSLHQWSGHSEGALAHAGSHGRRYANLALCPATPIGVGGWVRQPVCGGHIVRQALARPEQQQSPILEIIQAALRDAATAPTVYDALDVTGDALRRLAEIARAEVRHA